MTRLPPPKKHAQSSLTSLKIYYRASITVEKQEQKKTRFLVKPRHSGSGQSPLTEPTHLHFRPICKHTNNSEATVCQALILVK